MDATSYISRQNAPYQLQKIGNDDLYIVDVTAVNGLTAIGTHNLVAIPKGKTLKRAQAIILTAAASAGAATAKFAIGANAVTGDIALANLVAGNVIDILPGATGIPAYAAAAAIDLNLVIGTAAMTAFKFALLVETVDMSEVLNNG